MRRALIVTYDFPPAGGSGVHRPAAWARHLRSCGYEPVILTAGPEWHENAAPESETLAGSSTLEVWRTGPDRFLRRYRLLKRFCPINLNAIARALDPRGFWAWSALSTGEEILRSERINVILTTAPPYLLNLVGAALSRRFDLPWVMDLRSPWATALAAPWLGGVGYFLDRALQTRWCDAATRLTMPDREAAERLLRARPVLRSKLARWVHGGFEPADLSDAPVRRDGKFCIVHMGVFYWNRERDRSSHTWRGKISRWLQYAPDDVDMSPHSAGPLLRGVRRLQETHPRAADNLRVVLVGQLHRSDTGMIDELGLGDTVETTGQLPHAEAMKRLGAADALYLPFWWSRKVGRVIRIPSKVYEYLGTRKPILAVVGPGDLRDILEKAGGCVFCESASEGAIAERLLALCERRDIAPTADDAYVAEFEWSAAVGKMAAALDEAVAQYGRGLQTPVGATRT